VNEFSRRNFAGEQKKNASPSVKPAGANLNRRMRDQKSFPSSTGMQFNRFPLEERTIRSRS
jgi:hypothetical protein